MLVGGDQVRLALAVDGDVGGQESAALRNWLGRDDTLRGQVQIQVGDSSRPGAMGQALELVNVVLSNTLTTANLLLAVAAWRQSRPRRSTVRIDVDGSTFTLDTNDPRAIEALARALREATRPDGTQEGDTSEAS
jgi:hypothetical protein